MDMMRQDCERYWEKEIWLIPEDTLTKYLANGDRLSIALPSWFEKDSSGEVWQLMEKIRVSPDLRKGISECCEQEGPHDEDETEEILCMVLLAQVANVRRTTAQCFPYFP